ncbi:MAG: arylsulfatase [Kiritimatiellae bacterium]|nr:arylsulfatase [Kiritimatiellia bacterium]
MTRPRGAGAADPVRPNIVFILTDDLGPGDLSFLGQTGFNTPNIDRLAAEGMVLARHYAGSAVCAPSRSTLMTGQHTGHTHVRANGPCQLRTGDQDVTVAQVLQSAGYRTGMVGKASTGCSVDPGQPKEKGFDFFYGFNSHGAAHHYYPPKMYRNSEEILFPNNHKHTGDTYSHDLFLEEVLSFIRGNKDEPFFLHYTALLPHASLVVPEEWIAPFRGKFEERTTTNIGSYAPTDEPMAIFAGMVTRLDWEVGQIMDQLKALGLDENTLVMFTSDHGPHSAGGHLQTDFNSSGGLRGEKRDLYEGGIRVPMIARWPGRIAPGSRSDHVSAFWDFLPTAGELAGVSGLPDDIDGISYLPTLLGKPEEQKKHDYLYWEFYEQGGKRAALFGDDIKAVQLDVATAQDGPVEIYDLKRDPAEETDIGGDHPDLVQRAREIFEEAHTPNETIQWSRAKSS